MALELPYRDLPFSRNTTFRFRSLVLSELAEYLQPGKRLDELRSASLCGLGGVGKTQIALEFAYRHAHQYDAIFWVKAETVSKLRESYTTYGDAIGSASGIQSAQHGQRVDVFKKWLMSGQVQGGFQKLVRWLLILDNVDSANVLREFWPLGCHGAVILTTRVPEAARLYGSKYINVPLFTREQSQTFLIKANAAGSTMDESIVDEQELEAIHTITRRLGDLPLVLDQVGSYVNSVSLSYRSFLRYYSDFDCDFLFAASETNFLSFYQSAINKTWLMKLSRMGSQARALMETLSLLDADGVSVNFFSIFDDEDKLFDGPHDGFPQLSLYLEDTFKRRQDIDTAISALRSDSLVSRHPQEDSLVCHRIVKEAVIQSLDPSNLVARFQHTVFTLNAKFPKIEDGVALVNEWGKCAASYPHLLSLLNIYQRYKAYIDPPVLVCEIVRRCAWYLTEKGSLIEASDILKTGCEILERATARDECLGYFPQYLSRLTTDLYGNFGTIEYELNRSGLGQTWHQKAKSYRQQLLDDDDADEWDIHLMTVIKSNIALSSLADGLAESSIDLFTSLLNRSPEHGNRNIWAANLGLAYRIHRSLDDSLKRCRIALSWTEEISGTEDLVTAFILYTMGNTFLLQKDDDEALQCFEFCLRIRQQKAPGHFYTGLTCHKLGVLMRDRADLQNGIVMLRSALNVLLQCESRTGAVLRTKHVLATTLHEIGESDEAGQLKRDVLSGLDGLDGAELESSGWDKATTVLSEEFLDQFVLYCHR